MSTDSEETLLEATKFVRMRSSLSSFLGGCLDGTHGKEVSDTSSQFGTDHLLACRNVRVGRLAKPG